MERTKTARNVAIILVIAAAVYALPGGGRAASTFEAVLLVGFGFGLVYLAVRLYREHRIAVHSLGDRYRALLYGALAVGVVAIVGRSRMWQTGLGELVWFALIALVVYTLVAVYRYSRTY
jgi:hypothetical protein